MKHAYPRTGRVRAHLIVALLIGAAGGTWISLGQLQRPGSAGRAGLAPEAPPRSGPEPLDAPALALNPPAAAESEAALPRDMLEGWIADLRAELVREPFQSRVFEERLETCLFDWTPELRAELERRLGDPPRSDADFAVLARLGRAQQLPLAPVLATRLRPLALREDLPFGVSLESARALVAAGGISELSWWCAALEGARDPRSRAIASGALDAVNDGAGQRFLVERALELSDPRTGGRLLDALGRALVRVDRPGENPARQAAAARLADLAGDTLADAGLRARALGVLRCIDPRSAERMACDWFLEPGAGEDRIEFAAASLRGSPAALATLQAAQSDARIDDLRRTRLAECVLFSDPEALAPAAREEALARMRTTLSSSADRAARRRALHALARYGTDEDRARVQQAAEGDEDLLARAAARSSLQREASDWR